MKRIPTEILIAISVIGFSTKAIASELASNLAPKEVSSSTPAAKLKCNWGEYNSPPYIIKNSQGQPTSGVIIDICNEVARRLGRVAEFVKTPRKRVEDVCNNSNLDLIITAKPSWLPKLASTGKWLPAFYSVKNAFVFQKSSPFLDKSSLDELMDLRLATTHGYHYGNKKLIEKLESREILNFSAKGELASLKMLIDGRVDAAIQEDRCFDYEKKIKPEIYDGLEFSKITINIDEVTPVLCPGTDIGHKEILKVSKDLIQSGKIETILNSYK